MNRWGRIAAGVVVLAAVAALCGCWSVVTLDETAEDQAWVVGVWDRIELRLPGNASAGYTWQLAGQSRAGVVELIDGPSFEPDAPDLCGSPGVFTFRFRALEKGSTRLRFEYRQPWEEAMHDTFEVALIVR